MTASLKQEVVLSEQAGRWVVRLLLILILLLALGLRLYGVNFGLPFVSHPDEPHVVDHAVATIKNGDWNPHRFIYPSGYQYVQTGVLSLHLLWGIGRGLYTSAGDLPDSSHIITGAPDSYLWARATTALFGTIAVLLAYLVGRRVFGPAAGLSAALLLALSPGHVEHSHFATTDVPMATLALLSLYLSLELLERGGAGRALLAGLAVGLTAGFKYNGIVIVAALLWALALRPIRLGPPEEGWLRPLGRLFNRELGLALLGIVAGFALACPFAFADLATFLDHWGFQINDYVARDAAVRTYSVGGRLLPPWLAYAHMLFQENPPAALACLGGILLALARRRRREMVVVACVGVYYLFICAYPVIFLRNFFPCLAGLIVLGGGFLAEGMEWLANRRWWRKPLGRRWPLLLTALLVAVAIRPARSDLLADARLTLPNSQLLARRWLDANLAPGEKVAAEVHPLLFKDALYSVTAVDHLSNYPLEAFVNHGYSYVVANSDQYGYDYARQGRLPEHYARLLNLLERVADFPGSTQRQPGPRVTIYRIPSEGLQLRHPLAVTVGQDLHLLGFEIGRRQGEGDLTSLSGDSTFRASEPFGLDLYFRPDSVPAGDFLVSLQLRAADGRVVVLREQVPCAGACPPTHWEVGKIAVEQEDLLISPVLPAGSYRLMLRFLDPRTRKPLPISPAGEDGGIIPLIEITVLERGS